MPLTPADVESKTFPLTNRLQQGYDPAEVDAFLDEVQAELTRLYAENEELQQQSGGRQDDGRRAGATPLSTRVPADPEPDAGATGAGSAAAGPGTTDTGDAERAASSRSSQGVPAPAADGPESAALRILLHAQRTADAAVAEAQAEAEEIRAETRRRSDELEEQLDEQRQATVGTLEERRIQLLEDIEQLRAFDHDYRTQLRSWFTEQLQELEARPEPAVPAGVGDDGDGDGSGRATAGAASGGSGRPGSPSSLSTDGGFGQGPFTGEPPRG